MMNEIDTRIPNTSTTWELWHNDTFDRDSPPYLQARGVGILRGLYQLWLYTLKEGIQDNGSASFSSFHLTWAKTAFTRVDVDVKPFDNISLLKLRQWAHLMSRDPEGDEGTPSDLLKQRILVLNQLAEWHYALLLKSDRWMARTISWNAEARELLARVEGLTNVEELQSVSEV